MDGTLVDSLAAAEATWTRVAVHASAPTEEVIRYSHGPQTGDSVARFLPHLPAAEQEGLIKDLLRLEIEEATNAVEISGAASVMESLLARDVPVAVVTSAARELAFARMRSAAVPVPPTLVAAEDVVHGNPAPDPYAHAAYLLGVPAKN